MASSSILILYSLLSLLIFLPNPTLSQSCHSQKFTTPNKSFSTCSNLQSLDAILHYTYNPTKSTLTMAFTAKPDISGGWISWAINPTDTGMAGAQSLIAHVKSDGTTVAVDSYDIQSYSTLKKGPLSLNVTQVGGESSSDGRITLFATWDLSGLKSSTEINHIWQVGPETKDGLPGKHDFKQANLIAKGKLDLSSGTSGSAPVGSPNEAPTAAPVGAPSTSADGEAATPALAPGGSAAAEAAGPASGKSDAGRRTLEIGFCLVLGLLGNLLL